MSIQGVDQVRVNAYTPDQAKTMAEEFRARPVADLRKQLDTERAEIKDVMKKASRSGEDGHTIYDFRQAEGRFASMNDGERREEFAKANDRMNLLGAVIEELTFYNDLENSLNRAGLRQADPEGGSVAVRPAGSGAVENLGIADILARNEDYRAAIIDNPQGRHGKTVDMTGINGVQFINAVFQRTGVSNSGWQPQIVRSGRFVEDSQRPPQLIEFLPVVQAMSGGYAWVQEGAISAENTSNRVPRERNEGQAVEEITLTVTEKSVKVEKLGCLIPVTEEQLKDEMGARAYLEMRLPQQVRQRLDYQALNGSGTAPFMQGFAGVSGINTYAAVSGADILDVFIEAAVAIYKDTFMLPNLYITNMDVFKKIILTKDGDDNYLYGSPMSAAFENSRVWGFRLAVNQAVAANTAYAFCTPEKLMVMGDGVELVYGYISNDFAKSQVTIRCTLRANFADLRPTSTCSITALNNAS